MTAGPVLVTGGAGFLGGHVVASLKASGQAVRVLDITQPPGGAAGDWVTGSVCDREIVREAMNGTGAVIHLAANPHLWAPDKTEFDRVNHLGTRNMLNAAREAGVSSFVHVSSLTTRVSGPTGGPPRRVNEACQPPVEDMLGNYPASKWRAEAAAREAHAQGLPVRIAIPTMPLGPCDRTLTPPTRMVLDFAAGRTPAFMETWVNLCDVRDMAAGIVALLDAPPDAEGYLLGGGDLRLGDFLSLLARVSGRRMPRHKVPPPLAETFARLDEWMADHVTGKPPTAPLTGVRLARRPILFDTVKAQRTIDFSSRPLTETVRDVLAWFEAEGLLPPQAG